MCYTTRGGTRLGTHSEGIEGLDAENTVSLLFKLSNKGVRESFVVIGRFKINISRISWQMLKKLRELLNISRCPSITPALT